MHRNGAAGLGLQVAGPAADTELSTLKLEDMPWLRFLVGLGFLVVTFSSVPLH